MTRTVTMFEDAGIWICGVLAFSAENDGSDILIETILQLLLFVTNPKAYIYVLNKQGQVIEGLRLITHPS